MKRKVDDMVEIGIVETDMAAIDMEKINMIIDRIEINRNNNFVM